MWAVVNELPRTQRYALCVWLKNVCTRTVCDGCITSLCLYSFRQQHMILLGIYYSDKKPPMNVFMRPIMEDINEVYQQGMISLPSSKHTHMHAHPHIAILLRDSFDLPARAMATNMKQWNGAYGCLYCEDSGTTVGGDHLHRYWPDQGASTARSHLSLLKNSQEAVQSGQPVSLLYEVCWDATLFSESIQVCGVKGPTVLGLHPCLDVVKGVVVDDLHGIYLGVTLHLWFDKANKREPFFLGNNIPFIVLTDKPQRMVFDSIFTETVVWPTITVHPCDRYHFQAATYTWEFAHWNGMSFACSLPAVCIDLANP